MTPTEQAAADKKEADRIAAEQKAATDAQNAEPVVVIGDAKLGGPFTIDGPGLGNTRGSLTIAGQPVQVTSWTDLHVKGTVPAGLKGEVVLTTSSGVRKGTWPYVKPTTTKTTTVTTEAK